MKNSIFYIYITLTISLFQNAYSLDTNAVRYYPLAVGNSWTYKDHTFFGDTRYKLTVTGTINTNGHLYYVINGGTYQRIDSVKGVVRTYASSQSCLWLQNEVSMDSLSAKFRDSSKALNCMNYYRCIDDSSYSNIFSGSRRLKAFDWTDYFEMGRTRTFVKDIGLISDHLGAPNAGWFFIDLLGCVINEVLYGDTTLTGINTISNEIPLAYQLYQNYPNPFNPATNIKYQITKNSFVKLAVFNVLGEEVSLLVNENQKPGTYEVNWDAENTPSGVYFYKLIAGDFIAAKKMILIK